MSVQKHSLSEQIAGEIQNMIYTKKYAPGDRLPPEDVLAKSFGVSRITIREAVLRLRILGVVEVRQGSGTYIREITPYAYVKTLLPMLSVNNNNLKDIFEVRQIIECKAAELAASRATDADLKRLREQLAKMQAYARQGSLKQYNQIDHLFHYEIACCSKNQLLITIEELISDLVENSISVGITPLNALNNSILFHSKIYEAIAKSDSTAASMLMEAHLQGGILYVEKYLETEDPPYDT